jgi:hypothetical protein
MTLNFYIYYKVPAERSARVRSAAEALQQGIVQATGIQGQLLCRRDKPETWMETYEGIPDGTAFETILNRELARVGFSDALGPEGRRMTELFRPL